MHLQTLDRLRVCQPNRPQAAADSHSATIRQLYLLLLSNYCFIPMFFDLIVTKQFKLRRCKTQNLPSKWLHALPIGQLQSPCEEFWQDWATKQHQVCNLLNRCNAPYQEMFLCVLPTPPWYHYRKSNYGSIEIYHHLITFCFFFTAACLWHSPVVHTTAPCLELHRCQNV